MKINPIYLDRFIKTKNAYLFPVMRGVYLSFNVYTLVYEDVEFIYTPKYNIDIYVKQSLEHLYSISYII